jgi:hypothetical protein
MADKITYYSKKELVCPVCQTPFKREEMMTGRGRLNAGDLNNELRRSYMPTQKYGDVNPLIYPITVCPNCFYATEKEDFLKPPAKAVDKLMDLRPVRAKYLTKIFGRVPDFLEPRDLISGLAGYVLAVSTYSVFPIKKTSSSVKRGVASLRASWLFGDLFKEHGEAKHNELAEVFYRKASEFYSVALENMTTGKESLDYARWLGPDSDYNYGYDGFLYVTGYLKYKTSVYVEDPYEKLKLFENVKRTLSKVFGMGRKAKDKPQVLLDLAREVYDKIGEDIDELHASLGDIELEAQEGEAAEANTGIEEVAGVEGAEE